MEKAIKETYKDDIDKRKDMMKKLKKMDPDYIWELQLGGLYEFENLKHYIIVIMQ